MVFYMFQFLIIGLWLSSFLVIGFFWGSLRGGFLFQKSRNGKMSVVNFARGGSFSKMCQSSNSCNPFRVSISMVATHTQHRTQTATPSKQHLGQSCLGVSASTFGLSARRRKWSNSVCVTLHPLPIELSRGAYLDINLSFTTLSHS